MFVGLDRIKDNNFQQSVICLIQSKGVCSNLGKQCFRYLASFKLHSVSNVCLAGVFGRLFSGNSTFDLDGEQMVVRRLLSC